MFDRPAVCRGASDDRLMCDELRERDCSDDTLPFETIVPSGRRGELGTNDVAVPFGSSCGAASPCPFPPLAIGYENERETRAGEYWPERSGASRLTLIGDGRFVRMPREDVMRWMDVGRVLKEPLGEAGTPPVSERPSSMA